MTILDNIKSIVRSVNEKGINDDLLTSCGDNIDPIASLYGLTPIQVVLFALIIKSIDSDEPTIMFISKALNLDTMDMIQYLPELDELEKKHLISTITKSAFSKNTSAFKNYFVSLDVLNAVSRGEPYEAGKYVENADDLLGYIDQAFDRRYEDNGSYEDLKDNLLILLKRNTHIQFAKKIVELDLNDNDKTVLIGFFQHFLCEDNENVGIEQITSVFRQSTMKRTYKMSFAARSNKLFRLELIQQSFEEGFLSKDTFCLTDKTKDEFLTEFNLSSQKKENKQGLILAADIKEKPLFYTEQEQKQIDELTDLLQEKNYKRIVERLKGSNYRTGFAILFSGGPGTGKTESVFQIARMTGRDIYQIDISQTKTAWFGESEKKVKAIFDKYRRYVRSNKITPILFINEADALISKRQQLGNTRNGPAQTENSIQNIILQEMENLNGIMICTSNLTENFDSAFSRRFLVKQIFTKPDKPTRAKIWQSMLPDLDDEAASALAGEFDFSGGNIENVARKYSINQILHGTAPDLDGIRDMARQEKMTNGGGKRIGFV